MPRKKSSSSPVSTAAPAPRGKVLVIEDEPEFFTWVEDLFDHHGLDVVYAKNLDEAGLRLKDKPKYRLIVVDMNIPAPSGIDSATKKITPLSERYPGISAAIQARSEGYKPSEVIVYTVYDDETIAAQIEKIDCRYVLKGRPDAFKQRILISLGKHGKPV